MAAPLSARLRNKPLMISGACFVLGVWSGGVEHEARRDRYDTVQLNSMLSQVSVDINRRNASDELE